MLEVILTGTPGFAAGEGAFVVPLAGVDAEMPGEVA